MNLQMCKQSPGRYLMLTGTATKFAFRQGEYGTYGLGALQDQNGQVEDMFFASSDKSPLPQQSLLGVSCVYTVMWDANKQKFKAYFKSYSNQSQSTPQTPQDAPQSTNSGSDRDMLEKIYKVLQAILEAINLSKSFEHDYDLDGQHSPDETDDTMPF